MSEYTCKYCDRIFNRFEHRLTNETSLCILHCKKDTWYEIQENGLKDWTKSQRKTIYFWLILNKFIQDNDDDYCELSKMLFPIFYNKTKGTFINNYVVEKNIGIYNSTFLDTVEVLNTTFNGFLTIDLCSIIVEEINFNFCNFNQDVNCQYYRGISQKSHNTPVKLSYDNSTFNKNILMNESKYSNYNLNFQNTAFNSLVNFQNSIFNKVNFINTRFNGTTVFTDSTFEDILDLRDAIFTDEVNFLDIKSQEKNGNVKIANRETARKIKYSFEKLGNKIEANRYHTLELEQKRIELEKEKSKNWKEYLVFKIHDISSEHSTNWFRALLWIFIVGLVTNLFNNSMWYLLSFPIIGLIAYVYPDDLEKKLIIPIVALLAIIFISNEIKFDNIFKFMSIITKQEDFNCNYFLMTFNKVSLGYLYYQFLMSVRKDTRK